MAVRVLPVDVGRQRPFGVADGYSGRAGDDDYSKAISGVFRVTATGDGVCSEALRSSVRAFMQSCLRSAMLADRYWTVYAERRVYAELLQTAGIAIWSTSDERMFLRRCDPVNRSGRSPCQRSQIWLAGAWSSLAR